MNHLDLYSGIGGFALAAYRAGSVLRDRPVLPVGLESALADGADCLGRVDVLTAGYPCQPFSTAARGRNGARDWWPVTLAVVQRLRPVWVVLENVPGRRLAHIDRSCDDLEYLGYAVWPFDVAVEIRNHVRRRIWVVAHSDREGEPRCTVDAQVARIREAATRRRVIAEPLGMDARLPGRMDRMHALGNSIETWIAELVFNALLSAGSVSNSGEKHERS